MQIKSSTLFSGYLQSREPNTAFFLLDEENRPYMANIVLQKDFIFPAVSQEKPFLDHSTLYLTGSSPSRLPLRFGLALASSEQDVLLQNSFLEKNAHGIAQICKENGVSEELTRRLQTLASLHGSLAEILPIAPERQCD